MHFSRAALALAVTIAPYEVLSQVVTITERPSACSAIYTTGSSSVTVVQSTVTVAPIPFSDAVVNAGAPFVIEVQVGTAARRRQASNSTYINANGRTTTNASEAVAYRILNGTLQSVAGEYISADAEADNALFALSAVAKDISTTFFSRDLKIGWNNTAFAGGACEFFTTAAEDGAFDIVSYFRGVVDASWSAVTFVVTSTGDLVLDPTTSTTVSIVISMGGGATTTPTVTASAIETPVPTPTGVPTENGYCGAEAGICDGIIFGSCCSQYGACGNTDEYCGIGCQSEFGACDEPVVPTSSGAAPIASTDPTAPIYSTAPDPPIYSTAPTAPIYSATAPQPATSSPAASPVSSIVPVASPSVFTSTSVFFSTSGSMTMTMTTMVPVTTSLPIYSAPGTIIGPINPPIFSSSVAAVSSSMAISSPGLPPSYAATPSSSAASTFAGISSVPVVSIPTSVPVSISVSTAISSSARPPVISTSAGPGTIIPSYSAPIVASSSLIASVSITSSVPVVVPSSSQGIPLPSFYSSPAAPVSSVASSAIIPPILSTRISSSSTAVASSAASSCPGAADGTIVADSNGEPYMVYCDSDYVGDLTPIPDTPSFDACLLACDRIEGCAAVTYAAASTYCYPKPAGGFRFGTGGYVGVRVNGPVVGSSSSMAMVSTTIAASSTPVPDTYPTTLSVPALPTEESMPAEFSTTFTPEIASSTALPTDLPPTYSATPSIDPIFSSTPIPETYPTTTSIPEVFSSTPLPDPVFSSTPIPDTYPTPSTTDTTPSSTVLVLSSPIRCDFGEEVTAEQDDSYCEITLPQPMVLYSKSSVNTFASTNGFISIIDGATQYQNDGTLPTDQVTEADNETPLSALFPFWDDLNKPAGEDDYGIYYQLSDTGVTYEYYLTRLGQLVVFHFTVEYTYSNPGVAVFTYYEMDDPGDSSTVGSQGCKFKPPVVLSYQC